MQQFHEVNYGSFSANGKRKSNNEDYYSSFVPENTQDLLKSGSLFIVADGVGGAAHGELASKYAAELVIHEYYQQANLPIPDRLRLTFQKANRDIHEYAEESGRFSKMATTMVAAVVVKNMLYVANVGDSRAYLIRNGNVRQITRDHSVVEEMVRSGAMTEEEARVSSIRNRLSRSIGGEYEVSVDVFPSIPLQLGDKILLCTDGLTRYAMPEDIYKMSASGQPEEITKLMVRFANQAGGADNTTASLIEVVEKAKKRKKPLLKQGEKPDLEEWQKAETEYTRVRPTPGGKKQNPMVIILPVLAVSVFVFTLYLFKYGGIEKYFGDDETPPPATVIPTSFIPEESTPSSQAFTEEEQSQESGQLQETQPALGPDEQSNEPPAATEAEIISPTQAGNDVMAEQVWECVYLYQDTDLLSNTLYAFGKEYVSETKYFYYSECIEEEGNAETVEKCTPIEPKEINDPHRVYESGVSKWIIIYNSLNDEENWDRSECIKDGRNGRIFIH